MKKRERYEKRLYRILRNAGYTPAQIMNMTVDEMVEVNGITVPNIRSLLFLQQKFKEGEINAYQSELCHRKQRKCRSEERRVGKEC